MYQFMSKQLRSPSAFATITSDASYVLMCRCCFLADNLEICATNNTRMSYSLFTWIPLKFCFDLPVKRCARERD